jgi:hypothetical protein
MENFRSFPVGPDPFGRTWQVWFKWLQTAISIRHSDSVDAKFILQSGEDTDEKTISLPHFALRELAAHLHVPMTDAWCSRIAKQHLERLILSGEDMEKAIVTPSAQQLLEYAENEKHWETEAIRKRRGAA